MIFIGLDVGGAHLKMAVVEDSGRLLSAEQFQTPLWQGLSSLQQVLEIINMRFPAESIIQIGITMTGELVDLFKTREQGVVALTDCLSRSLKDHSLIFYAAKAGFIKLQDCHNYSLELASANWHATAEYAASKFEQGVLFDLGSTTADIIPFAGRRVLAFGNNDHDRLCNRELCYSGVVRTPVMALVDHLPWRGESYPVMNEHFATMADVYRITGELPDHVDQYPAADEGEKDLNGSIRRLARMLGLDVQFDMMKLAEWGELAHFISQQQQQVLIESLDYVLQHCAEINREKSNFSIIGAGAGRFLIRTIANELQLSYVDIASIIDCVSEQKEYAADCATAVAVAHLMRHGA